MKRIYTLFFLILTILISSCSSDVSRSVASDPVSPVSLDELLTIKSTTEITEDLDPAGQLKEIFQYTNINIDFIEDPKMDTSAAYKILPVIEDQRYKLKIFSSAIAKKDKLAGQELLAVVHQLLTYKFLTPTSIYELYFNMKAGDYSSLKIMAKIRSSALAPTPGILPSPLQIERAEYWKEVEAKFQKEDRVYNKKIKEKDTARRAVMDVLDKVSDDQQFRTLVARNDRKGAANLLKSYLPWELMAPFEKQFWETHLKVMADPLPLEERVLIYRGIDDDIVQVAETAGKVLSREEAIKEQKIFLMSTMMTKNQGSWNRRLRSLTSMNEKYIATNNKTSSEFTRAARITTMFTKHASNPQGSPFLSYTPSFASAYGFGSKRNTAYLLDPRMIYFNYGSIFSHEVEFLLPLMSFPDELVAVWDKNLHSATFPNSKDFFSHQLNEKLSNKLGKEKGAEAVLKIIKNSAAYFSPAINQASKGTSANIIEDKSMQLLKSLHGMPASKASELLKQDTEMKCADLIKVFWN